MFLRFLCVSPTSKPPHSANSILAISSEMRKSFQLYLARRRVFWMMKVMVGLMRMQMSEGFFF